LTFVWAAYCVLIKACQIEADSGTILLVATIVGTIIQAQLSAAEVAVRGVPRISINDFLAVGYLGIGAAALGFLAWQHAVRHLGPTRSGVFLNLVPIFGVAMSVGILHEQVLWHHVVGGMCVVTGIVFAQIAARRAGATAQEGKTPSH
jgi:drug/metabolite transporter (DMT)-like permease